ncbi:MAG TPA: hypothetical protein VL125_13910 [Pelobium sp.]|nr:hypothetical protein [Pelobium sp.]
MLTPNHHNDSEKIQFLYLLSEMRKLRKDMGGYIEHYYHNEDTIVVKLTNGILKIEEKFLEQYSAERTEPFDKELRKLADGFVVSTII